MGRWRVSWGARNLSVLLAWPTARTRLPLWFRATASSVLMGVSPDTAAGSAGSAGCLFMRVSLWRSLRQDKSQKRHESPERGCWVCGRAFLEDHEPATPLGTGFRNATEVKMNGSDCVIGLQRDHRRARAASTRRSAPLSNCASIRRAGACVWKPCFCRHAPDWRMASLIRRGRLRPDRPSRFAAR